MTVFLIYEMNPEATMIFRYDNPDMAKLGLLRRCHGCYINACTDGYAEDVINFLTNLTEDLGGHKVFDNTGVDAPSIKVSGDCEIIVAGFIL